MSAIETIRNLVPDIDLEGVEIRKYSGRGMYGKECLAIVCDGLPKLLEFCLNLQEYAIQDDEEHDVQYELARVRHDSMGLSQVFYWPSIAPIEGSE